MNKFFKVLLTSTILFPLISCVSSTSSDVKNTIGFMYYYNDATMTCTVGAREGFNLEKGEIEEYWTRKDDKGNEYQYKIVGIYISDERGDYFLNNNKYIKSFKINNSSIETLPYDLFRNSSLEEIDLSGATSLKVIGDHVFENSQLKKITLPPSLEKTYKGVFAGSKLESVTFPSTYEKMDIDTFFNCPNLKEVNLGTNLKEIGGSSFERTPNLTKVVAPSLRVIGAHSFRETPMLKDISLDKVNSIGDYAFYHSGIEKVSLNNCTLGSHVFRESKLKDVSLNNVPYLPYKTFGDCYDLTNLTLKGNIYEIGPSAFKNANIKEVNMPNTVTFIGSEAFYQNKNLSVVNLSTSLESISTDAFRNCHELKEIIFPSSLKRIRDGAFLKTSLKEVSLSKDVELLGNCFDASCNVKRT